MKNLIILLLFPLILFANINTKDKYIYQLVNKENNIINLTNKYLYLTADSNITTTKLNTFFELTPNFWKGLYNNITISLKNNKLDIIDLLTNKDNIITNNIKKEYLSIKKPYKSYIKNKTNVILLNNKIKNYLNFIKNLDKNKYFIDNYLTNYNDQSLKNKFKLKRNGNGYTIEQYNTTDDKWEKVSSFGINNNNAIIVNNSSELTPFIDLKNIKKIIINNNQAIEVKYLNNQWKPIIKNIDPSLNINNSTNINYNAFNKDIYEATCFLNNYNIDDIINLSNNIESYILNPIEITKKIDNNTMYWSNEENTYLFINSRNQLNNLSTNIIDQANYIYICTDNKQNYIIRKSVTLNGQDTKVFELPNSSYLSIVNNDLEDSDYIYLKDMGIYFQYTNGFFYSKYQNVNGIISSNENYIIGIGDQKIFDNFNFILNKTYLTTEESCSYYKNCAGNDGLYAGKKIDNLYSWNLQNNKLLDIKTTTFYNGFKNQYNTFLDINDNKIYYKIFDNWNNICYKDKDNNYFYINKLKVEDDFIFNDQLNFPINNLNCNNIQNKLYYSKNMKYQTSTNFYTGKYILLSSIKDLKNINTTNFNLPLALNINNETILFKKINNQFVSYKYVIGLDDRNSLEYIDDSDKRIYYTFNLGTDELTNNGTYNNQLGLYTWSYNITSPKQINGFIDLIEYDNLYLAYNNITTISNKVKINNIIFEKESFTNGIDNFECLKNIKTGIYYNSDNTAIPVNYIEDQTLKVPKNYNCKNIKINYFNGQNYIELKKIEELKDLSYLLPYKIDHFIYQILSSNVLLSKYNNTELYIVLGNRYNFNETNYLNETTNHNFNNKVYTLYTTDMNNYTQYILGNTNLYEWNYLDTPYSINKLINNPKYKDCYEAYTYYGIDNKNITIKDKYGKNLNVFCSNGNTVLMTKDFLPYIKIITNTGQNSYDSNTGILTLYSNFIHEFNYFIDIPLDFSYYEINLIFPKNLTLNYNTDFTFSNYQNFINGLTDNSTNYLTFGAFNSDGSYLGTQFLTDNNNNIYYYISGTINNNKILIKGLNYNLDKTDNTISFYSQSKIVLHH